MYKILVTGGSGFIGQRLVPELERAGHTVTVLTRNIPKSQKLFATTDCIEHLPEASQWNFDVVINLAGKNLFESRWNEQSKQEFCNSRINTTTHIINRIRDGATLKLLISGSAIGYYGERDASILKEDAAAGNDFPAALCKHWEAAATEAQTLGVATAIIRTGVVLDPQGGAMQQLLPPFKMAVGGRLGSGKQWFSWISRRDYVDLLLFILKLSEANQDVSGVWNGTAPEPVTNQRFTQAVGKALRRPTAIPMPSWALKLIMGEAAQMLLTGQRVVPARALQEGFQFKDNAIESAMQQQLGSNHHHG